MDETKIELIGLNEKLICLEKRTHCILCLRIVSHLWNMVVVVAWLGPVLLHLGQGSLPSLMEQWILSYTSKFYSKRLDICLRTESQENVGHAPRQRHQAHKSFYQRMLKKNKVNVLEWLNQRNKSPDLNLIQMLWKNLSKQSIGRNPSTS